MHYLVEVERQSPKDPRLKEKYIKAIEKEITEVKGS